MNIQKKIPHTGDKASLDRGWTKNTPKPDFLYHRCALSNQVKVTLKKPNKLSGVASLVTDLLNETQLLDKMCQLDYRNDPVNGLTKDQTMF